MSNENWKHKENSLAYARHGIFMAKNIPFHQKYSSQQVVVDSNKAFKWAATS